MSAVTAAPPSQQQQQSQQKAQQQQPQQQQQQQPRMPQPAVDKVRQLLYRRLKVVLPSGRIIEGDLACLDKQGNLILSNASEHILTAEANSTSSSSSSITSNTTSSQPQTTQLGMVLVPKAQQQEVSLRVSLAEKAALLNLTAVS